MTPERPDPEDDAVPFLVHDPRACPYGPGAFVAHMEIQHGSDDGAIACFGAHPLPDEYDTLEVQDGEAARRFVALWVPLHNVAAGGIPAREFVLRELADEPF